MQLSFIIYTHVINKLQQSHWPGELTFRLASGGVRLCVTGKSMYVVVALIKRSQSKKDEYVMPNSNSCASVEVTAREARVL